MEVFFALKRQKHRYTNISTSIEIEPTTIELLLTRCIETLSKQRVEI